MTVFEKNKKELFKRYPEFELQVNEEEVNPNLCGDMAGDKWVLFYKDNNETFLLDSLYETDDLLSLWRNSIPEPALYNKFFIFGLGNGMMAKKLLETTDSTNRVIVYEPNMGVLLYVMQHVDMTELFKNERLTLIIGSALKKTPCEAFVDNLTYTDMNTFQYYVYPNYNYIFLQDYLLYMSEMERAISSIKSNQNVLGRFNEAFFENTFANIRFLGESKSLKNLYERIPEGMPAIVVASGPSLDKNVSELKRAKNKAFIIAADSSLRTILNAGVVPDMCVTIDPKKLSKHFSNDAAYDVPMVCHVLSNREILNNHRACKFFTNDLNHHIQDFCAKNDILFPVLASGGSVANDAFSVCQMLGFNTIIMIGQDLAYTGNKTHSASSVRGEWNIDISKYTNNVMIEDIEGNQVVSSGEFVLYKGWIEEQIVAHPELTVIDATEGGAKIKGTEIMTLSNAIDKYCLKEIDYGKIISETDKFMSEEESIKLLDHMRSIPQELEKCLDMAKEGIRIYEQMLKMIYSDKYHSQGFKNLFEKTKTVTEYLDTAPVMEYVKNYIQNETNEFLKNIYRVEKDERAELIASCNIGIDYLKLEKKGMESLIPMIKDRLEQYGI